MADLLNLGTSALLSLQRAISTTGHNIANVGTEGYSRQQANFATLPSQFLGGNYIGTGVTTASIARSYDQFLTSEVRSRTASESGFQAFYELSSRLDGVLADPDVGLTSALDGFFGAVHDAANNPGSLPERQVLLGEAEALASNFHYLDDNFRTLGNELNAKIEASVTEINALAQSIADLNGEVVRATARSSGEPPNDLLDTRDQLINELAEMVGVTTVEQSDGGINVMVGKGQPLVVGSTASQLQTAANPFDASQRIVGVASPSGELVDIGRFLDGGELGATLSFRQRVLDPAINQLGLLAVGIAETFNAQHQLGMDLNGQAGGEFFLPLQASFGAHPGNSGSASLSIDITDAAALTGDDYSLRFNGGQWTLRNLTTDVSQTGAGPFTVDGLTINVGGAPANGDTFTIQPTRQGASLFSVAIDQPEDFAAASPLRSGSELSNAGDSYIGNLLVTDASGLPLAGQVTLTFNPDALGVGVPGFDLAGIGGGPLAYDPATQGGGALFSVGGMEFSVSGDPQPGDELTITNNIGGSGDNRNALVLAGMQTSPILSGGTASYQDTYSRLVADVAVQSKQAKSSAATESALLAQASNARDSVSGVNLDEEAANLIRYQQAYQAAAQMISVADQLFQTLLNATRR